VTEIDYATGLGRWQTVSTQIIDEEKEREERERVTYEEAEVRNGEAMRHSFTH
jgi:hypothetical protein